MADNCAENTNGVGTAETKANELEGLYSEEGCGVDVPEDEADAGAVVANDEGNSGDGMEEDNRVCAEEDEEEEGASDGQNTGEGAKAAVEAPAKSSTCDGEDAEAVSKDSVPAPEELEAESFSGSETEAVHKEEKECGTEEQGVTEWAGECASPQEMENEGMHCAAATEGGSESTADSEEGADVSQNGVRECGRGEQGKIYLGEGGRGERGKVYFGDGDGMQGIVTMEEETECSQAEDAEKHEHWKQVDENMVVSEGMDSDCGQPDSMQVSEHTQLDDQFATIRDAPHIPRSRSRTGSANRLPSLWANLEAKADADWASSAFSGSTRTSQHSLSPDTHMGAAVLAESLQALPKVQDGRRRAHSPSSDSQLSSLAVKFGGDYNVWRMV